MNQKQHIMKQYKRHIKPLAEMCLLDRFLFSEAMEDPENVNTLLRIIFDNPELTVTRAPQTEKEFRTCPDNRSIRVDVWSADADGTVYDIEPQNKDTQNLPKRSRYYQGVIDSNLLPSGEPDFNSLPNSCIIEIMPFDIFGHGRYVYTFQAFCEEDKAICLGDGATRIFLNTHGTNDAETRPKLVSLLHYLEHTNMQTALESDDENIINFQKRIAQLKSSKEVNLKFMQEWEERYYIIQDAVEEATQKLQEEKKHISAEKDRIRAEKSQIEEENIKNIFQTAHDFGASREAAIQQVIKRCHLSPDIAEDKAQLYFDMH